MLRSTSTRPLFRGLQKVSASISSYAAAPSKIRKANIPRQLANKRPQAILSLARPSTTSWHYATKSEPPYDHRDTKLEEKTLGQTIEPHPEDVSTGSSVRHVFEGGSAKQEDEDIMLGGVKADLKTIKETFALTEVPKESLVIGAFGVVPYAATSLSTVYLAYDINHAADTGSGIIFSPETAHQLLDMVTPIQIGYGAVIISFLGAIHWGLEYAGYGGTQGYRRYIYGVIAPAVAWPTMFMPIEYALITQFTAFTFLYFADARATVKGWFPPWYSTYRFVLTFFVGASIVISLIGRGQIAAHDHALRSPSAAVKADRDQQWLALEREERIRLQALMDADIAAQEAEDNDGDEGKDDDAEDEDQKSEEKGSKKDDKDNEQEGKQDDKKDDKKDEKKDEKK